MKRFVQKFFLQFSILHADRSFCSRSLFFPIISRCDFWRKEFLTFHPLQTSLLRSSPVSTERLVSLTLLFSSFFFPPFSRQPTSTKSTLLLFRKICARGDLRPITPIKPVIPRYSCLVYFSTRGRTRHFSVFNLNTYRFWGGFLFVAGQNCHREDHHLALLQEKVDQRSKSENRQSLQNTIGRITLNVLSTMVFYLLRSVILVQ